MKEKKIIEIPNEYLEILGEKDPGTRIYRTKGTDMDYRKWFQAVLKITNGEIVSPGGVPMYCHVSRAGLHKKLKNGGLTAFCFHFTKFVRYLFRTKDTEIIQRQSYMFFPICELQNWEKEILTKLDIQTLDNEDYIYIPKDHKLTKGKILVDSDLMDRKGWDR